MIWNIVTLIACAAASGLAPMLGHLNPQSEARRVVQRLALLVDINTSRRPTAFRPVPGCGVLYLLGWADVTTYKLERIEGRMPCGHRCTIFVDQRMPFVGRNDGRNVDWTECAAIVAAHAKHCADNCDLCGRSS